MRSTVVSAKTVEECVNKALDKLQANRNEVNIEVINEAKQGFWVCLEQRMLSLGCH